MYIVQSTGTHMPCLSNPDVNISVYSIWELFHDTGQVTNRSIGIKYMSIRIVSVTCEMRWTSTAANVIYLPIG